MGKYVYHKQLHDTAICLCHNVPAVLEEDSGQCFWLCEVDDRICEVRFTEVFS